MVNVLGYRKVIISAWLGGMLISQGVGYAEPLTNGRVVDTERSNIQSNIQSDSLVSIKTNIDKVLSQINEKEQEIQKLDTKIVTLMEEIKRYENDIKLKEEDKKKLEEEIKELQEKVDKVNNILKNRLKAYQMGYYDNQGLSLWIKVIFSAESLSDLVDKLHASITIMKADKELMDSYNSMKKELEEKQNDLDIVIRELSNHVLGLDMKCYDLEDSKKQIQKDIADLNKMKKDLEVKYKEEYMRLVKLQEEELKKKMEGVIQTLTSDETDEKVKVLIEEALKYQGVPYVWGGVTPEGFDCSGYMQYIFRSVGVELPRLSIEQKDVGLQVPLEEVKAGDLIFRYGEETNHIGLYIGNGLYIHAPRTGDVIKISKYNPSYWDVATRVFYTQEDVEKYMSNVSMGEGVE